MRGSFLTSGRCEEAHDEGVLAAGEEFVRLLRQLVLVLVAESLHVVLHLFNRAER